MAFGVAVVARAFRNGVATGLGLLLFFFFYITDNFMENSLSYDLPYRIDTLRFVAPSSLVILELRNTRDGAQRSPACFSCALFCLVAMASS